MFTPSDNLSFTDSVVQNGKGLVHLKHLTDAEGMYHHGRVFAHIVIDPGCSIGNHPHIQETEFYYILKGEGVFNDDGEEVIVHAGDLCTTGYGAVHGMENKSDAPLEMIALIVQDN